MSVESVWSVSDDEDSVGIRALHVVEMFEDCPTKIISASNGQKSIANVEGIVTPKRSGHKGKVQTMGCFGAKYSPSVGENQAGDPSRRTSPLEISEKNKKHRGSYAPIAMIRQDLQSRASPTPFPLSDSAFEAEA